MLLAERPPRAARREPTPSAILDHRRLRQAIGREYAKVALFPQRTYSWPVGRDHALRLGYPPEALDRLPDLAVESFCGSAYPFEAATPSSGETVVDLGCGSGVDALLAAERVGPSGTVIGVEPTEELARKASLAARRGKSSNARGEIDIKKGIAEEIPLADASADLVLANGVLNLLVADKEGALREVFRVLRPGGRLVLADIVVSRAASREERSTPAGWIGGLAGPIPLDELVELLRRTGFDDVESTIDEAAFAGTTRDEIARAREARRVVLKARKG